MFEWSPSYSVGVRAIDAQHENLFALARELHTAMASGKGKELAARILDRLVQYTLVHFEHEERLMREFQYGDYAAHKAEHDALAGKVKQLVADLQAGKVVVTIELLQFLKRWLETHIKGTDTRFGQHILKNVA